MAHRAGSGLRVRRIRQHTSYRSVNRVWGYLAYAVGFGGSMIWFGSSAGVALSNQYSEAKSVGLWLRHGWHVAAAYVVGFFVMLLLIGWHPDDRKQTQTTRDLLTVGMPLSAR
jgi:hypothetical protein